MGERERAADQASAGQGQAVSSELTLNVVPDLDGGVTVRLAGDVVGAHLGDLERRLRVLGSRGRLAARLDLGRVRGIDAAAFGRLARSVIDVAESLEPERVHLEVAAPRSESGGVHLVP